MNIIKYIQLSKGLASFKLMHKIKKKINYKYKVLCSRN